MATRTSRKPVPADLDMSDVLADAARLQEEYEASQVQSGDSVQAKDAEAVDAAVTASKPTAAERLVEVLRQIDKATAKPLEPADVKWGKAIGLLGGGSVYINRSNADVRSTTKQVADWAKSGLGTVRGPQGQYLRITF